MNWKHERGKRIEEYILFFHLCILIALAVALLSTLELSFTASTIYTNYPKTGIVFVVFGLTAILY
ncbi:MAG: hypothetical protein GX039_00695, partial [Clostridia bacterium]|nr:hypothetical protein [Clostridia bacterium]